ncbi:Hym1p [Stygiomarasmius scandens]|uniref:Hym1p n=1 Tax=Marasmiellus scandens TaxID=2682957 RepID=A0ABR1IR22_9AGAR
MATTTINFAKLVGQYDSLAAAIIFAILYVPLAVRFVFSLIRERTRILFVLTLFCLIRITSFTIRAVLVGSEGAGENEGLFIADQVLSSIGFVGLLLSAHGLVVNRLELDNSEPSSPISRITRNRRIFRLLTTTAAVLGIVGINYLTSTDASQRSTGETLKKVGIILFLVLTVNVVMCSRCATPSLLAYQANTGLQVFVANPKKPPQIENILRRNKDKLLVFLQNFHNDKEDEQFSDEKQFLIVQIKGL